MKLSGLPELSGVFSFGPDGLTIDDLRKTLISKYSEYVKEPEVLLLVKKYRPVKVYVTGEVARPGFYII